MSAVSPRDLIVSREEARLMLAGHSSILVGVLLMLGGGQVTGSAGLTVAGVIVAIGGILLLNLLTHRVSRRLMPQSVGALRRWRFNMNLGQHWFRHIVIRHALMLVR